MYRKRTVFLVLLFFFIGLFSRPYIKKYYYQSKSILNQILISRKASNCMPDKINKVPIKSIIIVGHAYGSSKTPNLGMSEKFSKFYDKNRNNIDMIIFSGDIFKVPSIDRWNEFYSKFEERVEIYISPGNHDVGLENSAKRDIYESIKHKNQNVLIYPFLYRFKNNIFIFDDSNKKTTSNNKLFNLINNTTDEEPIFIIRHHILPKSLSFAANAKGPQSYIDKSDFLIEKSKRLNNEVTFIYGDSGAKKYLPRITCITENNIKHIANGIGGFRNDTVLVINKNKIYRIEI